MAAPPQTAREQRARKTGAPPLLQRPPLDWLGVDNVVRLLVHARTAASDARSWGGAPPLSVWVRARDAHFAAVALLCGLRRAEACRLRVEQVSSERLERVLGKGHKERDVPLYVQAAVVTRRWSELRARGPRVMTTDAYFPATGRGAAGGGFSSVSLADKAWHRVMAAARIVGEWRLHDARHAGSILFYLRTRSLVEVARFLGHSRVGTTFGTYFRLDESADALWTALQASGVWQDP